MNSLKIGFTGTQSNLTDPQRKLLATILDKYVGEFHHGSCIGADAEAHHLATGKSLRIVIHPPIKQTKRAILEADEVRPEKEYHERNYDIVNEATWLIACPKEDKEVRRSGTWATIRYAIKQKKPINIIFPDGRLVSL